MVPISVANSSSLAVQHRTVIMAVQIGILLLMVACVVLYTYYKRYVSEKDHEIARRDILFSIMAKNLDDVYIMLSWGDWRKLYVSRNIERVLGIRSSEYDGANDLAKAEPIAATLYQKDSESTGVKVDISEADKAEYSYANGILTWNGEPTGTVYEHDVQFIITYTHDWGVVTKTFKVTVTRKVQ